MLPPHQLEADDQGGGIYQPQQEQNQQEQNQQEQNQQQQNQQEQNQQQQQQEQISGVDQNSFEFLNLISPWERHYECELYKRHYFFNPITNESQWELPLEYQLKVSKYYQQKQEYLTKMKTLNENVFRRRMDEYVEQKVYEEQRQYINYGQMRDVERRRAVQQVKESTDAQAAYNQGQGDYNIWYDKYMSDNFMTERKQMRKQHSLEWIHIGSIKSNMSQQLYFCLYFARGHCNGGYNCQYLHYIPRLVDCQKIQQTFDIFGRTRFNQYRSDMMGVGNMMKDCQSLYITNYQSHLQADDKNYLRDIYQQFLKYFGQYGILEDLNVIITKGKNIIILFIHSSMLLNLGIAFARFQHRCMAEFAKEAMQYGCMDDKSQILEIKWANDDGNIKEIKRVFIEQQGIIQDQVFKKLKIDETNWWN